MPGFEGSGTSTWTLPILMGQWSIVGFVALFTWLVLLYLLVNVWLLCIFTSLLVVLGGWLGSRAALDANSLLHLEHFLPLGQAPLPHVSLESERRLDWEIHSAVGKAVRDFVSSWYRILVSEEEGQFEREIRDAMLTSATELKRRARQVDRRALAKRVLELCGCHLQSFGQARERQKLGLVTSFQKQEGQKCSRSTLWKLYSEAAAPHPALASSVAELSYSRAVVDLLLHVLVPYPHLETRTGRYLVGELITCNVLLPLVAQMSNPDWLNQTVVDVFTKSAGQEESEGMMEEPPSPWDRDFHTPVPWDHSETSSMQTAGSNSTMPFPESSESSLQAQLSLADSPNREVTSESPYLKRALPNPPEFLRSPCRSSQLYQYKDYDARSPLLDGKKLSTESLDANDSDVDKEETFCDCIAPADFCGLMCLDDDTLALLGKRIRPKVLISEPLSHPESTVEESPGNLPLAGGPYLSPFGLETLGSLEGPVFIKNLKITGTITAKEQKGNSSHPYTLYTVKYETVVDTDSVTDQTTGYHTVNRRYSEFLNLQTRLEERSDLKKVIKNVKGPKKLFPDLSFGNPDADKVEARKGQLESFLKKLCSIPEAARSEEVQEFLALSTDASAAFEKKPCGSRIDKMVENIVDTLKTAFPRSEPQSPTDDGEPDADGRSPDIRKKSRLRFSSIIAPAPLSVPDFQPKITYCFSEGSTIFKGPLGLEGFVLEQEKRIDGEPRKVYGEKKKPGSEEQEEKDRDRAVEKRTRGTDTALADVALNILCLLMKDQWSWLCTENIQKTIRLLFGTIIERWLEVGIAHLTSAPCWVIYLRVLQEAVWPGGDLPVGLQLERSPEQREETRLQCLDCLMKLFPELIPDILGFEKYRLSWEHMLESLQDPHINRHLVYCVFDVLLEFLVPESSEEGFQKSLLHSLSGDVETTSAPA
ncbi:sorting nexin-19a [Salminus brasiliensis]|uniref:sorting nexin-19a n=1 Tax=Salminus brasiliensis TaxID=930266 RepID=UPI003B8333DA